MKNFNLAQVKKSDGNIKAAVVNGDKLNMLDVSAYELSLEAADGGLKISDILKHHYTGEVMDYDNTINSGKIQSPITHPEPSKQILSGTGLTHLGSAAPRNKMHSSNTEETTKVLQKTDTQKMFDLGVEGGRGTDDKPGVAPEWFYKGTGEAVNAPFSTLTMPDFSLDGGEEAEIAGIYIVSNSGKIFRVGYTLGNEFSDHVTERQNYLYLAHSKLRNCSFGPEIMIGDLPEEVTGKVILRREGALLWEQDFLSGEKHMCHSIQNLEYHHFKYDIFRKPGQLHIHFFGAAVLSCSEEVIMKHGDDITIECDIMSRPLKNRIAIIPSQPFVIQNL